MRFTMANVVLLFGFMATTLCQDSFYITTKHSSWSSNNDNCTLATPNVDISNDMNYQINERLHIDLPLNESVWVGYYKVDRIFEYVGCVSMENNYINDAYNFVEIQGDPGQCFPGCGDAIFIGVSGTRCYCLGMDLNLTDYTESWCNKTCYNKIIRNDLPVVICGGNDLSGRLYLSVYKVNQIVTPSAFLGQSEDKTCLAMDPGVSSGRFFWETCIQRLSTMCADGIGVHIMDKFNGWWGHSSWSCFLFDMVPTVFSDLKTIRISNGSKLWTGLFKTKVVYNKNTKYLGGRDFDKKLYGYLTRNSEDIVKLQFTDRNTRHRKLCVKAKHTTSTGVFTTTPKNKGVENQGTGIWTGILVSLVALLLVIVSITFLIKRRIDHKGKVYYITPAHSTGIHGNMATVPYSHSDHIEEHFDGYGATESDAHCIEEHYDDGYLTIENIYTEVEDNPPLIPLRDRTNVKVKYVSPLRIK